MNKKHLVFSLLLALCISCISFADRQLDRDEILQIFEKLTSQPRKTWITAGTIIATHEEYRAAKISDTAEIDRQINETITEYQNNSNKRELSKDLQTMTLEAIPFNVRYKLSNEYTMNSNVTVVVDGENYSWEIDVSSRTDSVTPESSLASNFMTDEFDLDFNTRRIYTWDGQKNTMYFLPGNRAIVDTTGSMPHTVTGPLTAGVIPWGYGYCTKENLSSAKSTADEKDINGQTQIHITIDNSDGSKMEFILDPGKDYAVISSSMNGADKVVTAQYGGYERVSDTWVPGNISIEKHDAGNNKLLAYDSWSFSTISGATPSPGSFDVDYEADALVEYSSSVTSKPAIYSPSYAVNTDRLLLDRLSYAASEGIQAQNCATAALKYTITQSGKNVTDRQLARLVNQQDKTTSLYAMKQFVQGVGLKCRAVKLDIDSLKKMEGCEVILHIPGEKHFVVLGEIDDKYVSRIDLANNKFYYRTDVRYFDKDWTGGTALLVSNQSIKIQGSFSEISDNQLRKITGSNGWQCIELLQEDDVSFCSYVGGTCGGDYEYYPERWGCEYVGSGYCHHTAFLRKMVATCIENPYYPDMCYASGGSYYYMWACG